MLDGPAVKLFRENWFLRAARLSDLTAAEGSFIEAAIGEAPARWDGHPDLQRMAGILAEHPDVLDRIGSYLLTIVTGMRGCGRAVTLLLDRGVLLSIDTSSYNVLHEAAWADSVDTLEAVFASGVADATAVSVQKPHTGWPANLSLMYWAAWGSGRLRNDLPALGIAGGIVGMRKAVAGPRRRCQRAEQGVSNPIATGGRKRPDGHH